MAARNDTAQRKANLIGDLRALYRSGDRVDQETMLRQRDLSERYGLSKRTIGLVLQELVEEGLLYTVPRIGTFLGRPPAQTSDLYLYVPTEPHLPQDNIVGLQIGFEDRIAQLGGSCLTLVQDEMNRHVQEGGLPPVSGMLELNAGLATQTLIRAGTPCVTFGGGYTLQLPVDIVDFDNEGGGEQATRHLLGLGHRRIAFMAMHGERFERKLIWSSQREAGWERMMRRAGRDTAGLAYHLGDVVGVEKEDLAVAARESAFRMVGRLDFTAVVVANVIAAKRLLEVLDEAEVPAGRWPAIVCFDSAPGRDSSVVSYLRLPWEKIGTEAAQLLWERKTGRLTGAPRLKTISMQLIPRLTCRQDWAMASSFVQGQVRPGAPGSRRQRVN